MSKYHWSFEKPPIIQEHSKVKHAVYRDYLRRYLLEVTKNPARDGIHINIVDGFAGGGVYVTGKEHTRYYGSPILLIDMLHEMQVELQAQRTKTFTLDWKLHLVDRGPSAHAVLRKVFAEKGYSHLIGERVFLHQKTFEDALPSLIPYLAARGRTIFILDQYGYTHVPLGVLSRIFGEMTKPEVILTFAFEHLSGFVQDFDALNKILAGFGIPLIPRDEFDAANATRGGLEFLVQRWLHKAFVSTASYFTPFFITMRGDQDTGTRGCNLAYWLIHLSQHPHARNVMTGLHWEKQNHFAHFGGYGQHMLGYDIARDSLDRDPCLFDDSAHTRTVTKLIEDLPRLLHGYGNGVVFRDFFADICNGSPADMDIYKDALARAAELRLIRIETETGGAKRKAVSLRPADRLFIPRQPTLYLPSHPVLKLPEGSRGGTVLKAIRPPASPPELPDLLTNLAA